MGRLHCHRHNSRKVVRTVEILIRASPLRVGFRLNQLVQLLNRFQAGNLSCAAIKWIPLSQILMRNYQGILLTKSLRNPPINVSFQKFPACGGPIPKMCYATIKLIPRFSELECAAIVSIWSPEMPFGQLLRGALIRNSTVLKLYRAWFHAVLLVQHLPSSS